MTSLFFRASRTVAIIASLGAFAAAAQAQGPTKRPVPASAVAPADSTPALVKPRSPSAPPSSVAPRTRAQAVRAAQPDSSAVRPMPAASAPVESVRPAAVPAPAVEPLPARTPPPRAAASMRAEPSAAAASLVSEEPPANATGRCKDGTWLTSAIEANACASNGGLAARFPVKPVLPKRP